MVNSVVAFRITAFTFQLCEFLQESVQEIGLLSLDPNQTVSPIPRPRVSILA